MKGAIEAQEAKIGALKATDISFTTSTKGRYQTFMDVQDRLTAFLRERISDLPHLKLNGKPVDQATQIKWLNEQVDGAIEKELNRSPFGSKY